MSKQTAVEKIKIEFYTYANPFNGFSEEPKWTISEADLEKLFEQAKEMEKEQIMDAFNGGMNDSVDYFIPSLNPNDESENYYNKAFKSE